MAISKVVVVDGNNLIVRIDRGVAGRGVTDVEPVEIDGSLYLVFTFSDGTTETVGPVGTIQYIGQAPIVVSGSTISLSTVPVNLGGTGQVTANAGFNALAPTQTGNSGKYLKTDGTNSAWDLLDISTADITGVLPLANGGTASSTASGARTNLGLGTIATQDASNVSITGGTITGITDLAVADGGTGASTASGARTNLNAADQALTLTAGTGLSGGGDLTANRSFSITNTGVTAAAYGAASKTLTATVNAQGQLTVLADTPIAIANTQISGLGTMSTQNANAVAITGGSITGITDLAVADGGTGASDAAGARTNLNAANQATTITAGTGLSGGGDLSANRTINIANTTVTAGAFGSASNTLTATVNAQGQLTALAATPIAIANTQVSGLGTMSTQNSNAVTITGGSITGITDLAIADGGTGASNAADARSNLGLGSAAVLNAGVALGVATLDAGGTVPLSQIPASIQGGVSYQGAWNASTNTPTLVSSVGSKGFYYVVSVAGNTNLNGVTDWLVGDWAIYNGTAWEKIDNTDQVASVNGYTGVVVLSNTDVGAPPTSLTISAGTGLTGGGSLAANRTLSIANTTVTAAPYGTASAVPTFTVNGQGQLTAASDVTIAIANTQVSGLGTMSTQNANSVAITGGSITGITDLAIADGGTGASTAGGALTNLGAIGSITSADGSIIVVPSGTSIDLAVSAASPASTLLTQIRNTTGATLTKGTVVYISGATGQIATVSKAIATGDATSAQTLGMITSNLANNSNGYVTVFGLLENMDTSAYTDGAQLYLSGTVAGAVTATKPSAPIHLVYVAVVEYAHPTQGKLLVKVQNGYELDEIHDVSIVTPVTGQTLVYNSATDLWVNNTVSLTAGVNGTLPILNGGTGQTTANAAFNALAPSQTGNSGKYLTTDGTDTSWASNPLGTVTSVAASVPSFLSIAGSPITTSGTLAISLSGTALPTTSGGTGLTSFTSSGVVYASSSSALATGSALTFDGTSLDLATVGAKLNFATTGSSTRNYIGLSADGYSLEMVTQRGAIQPLSYKQDFGVGHVWSVTGSTALTLNSTSLYTASGINVSIGASSTSSKLYAASSVNYNPSLTTGAASGFLINNAGQEISFGGSGVAPYPNYIQSRASGIGWDLVLNPLGGNVGVGVTPYTNLTVGASSDVGIGMSNSSSVTSGNRGSLSMSNSAGSTVGYVRFLAVSDNVGTNIQFGTRPVGGSVTNSMLLGGGTTIYNQAMLTVTTTATATRQNLASINKATTNWVRFTNPEYSTDASVGLLLKIFPDSDDRQGAGIVASGGINNNATDLSLFISDTNATAFAAYTMNADGTNVNHTWNTAANSAGLVLNSSSQLLLGATSAGPYGPNGLLISKADVPFTSSGKNLAIFTTNSQAADLGGSISLGGVYGGSTQYEFAAIKGAKATSTNNDASGYLALITTDSGNTSRERVRIDSVGNVGINQNNPLARLHIIGDQIRISNSVNASYYGTFSHDANVTGSNFYNSQDTGGHVFQNSGSTVLTLNNAGNLSLSSSAPNAWFSGIKALQFGPAGAIWSNSDRATIAANQYVDSGTFTRYIVDGFALKYAQELGAHTWYASASGTAGDIATTLEQVLQVSRNKTLALASATSQTGTGLTFPATQNASSNANTLDDYEEGTWYPRLFSDSVEGTSYASQTGYYTKVGRLVTCWFGVSCTLVAGTYLRFGNLPYSVGTSGTGYQSVSYANGAGGNSTVYIETYLGVNGQVFQSATGYVSPVTFSGVFVGGVYQFYADA